MTTNDPSPPAAPPASSSAAPASSTLIDGAARVVAERALIERAARVKKRGCVQAFLIIASLMATILAVIAVPNYVTFNCRALQAEARSNLKAFAIARFTYRAEFDHEAKSFDELYWTAKGTHQRYDYFLSTDGSVAVAVVKREHTAQLADDLWIAGAGVDGIEPVHIVDGCRR